MPKRLPEGKRVSVRLANPLLARVRAFAEVNGYSGYTEGAILDETLEALIQRGLIAYATHHARAFPETYPNPEAVLAKLQRQGEAILAEQAERGGK